MEQKQVIWLIVNDGDAPISRTIIKYQLNYISTEQIERYIFENFYRVYKWWR